MEVKSNYGLKKILSIMLVVLMVLSLIPFNMFAVDEGQGDGNQNGSGTTIESTTTTGGAIEGEPVPADEQNVKALIDGAEEGEINEGQNTGATNAQSLYANRQTALQNDRFNLGVLATDKVIYGKIYNGYSDDTYIDYFASGQRWISTGYYTGYYVNDNYNKQYIYPLYVYDDEGPVVAYCFEAEKRYPTSKKRQGEFDPYKHQYTKIEDVSSQTMKYYSAAGRNDCRVTVLRTIYNGYPYNMHGLQQRYYLTDMQFRAVTQAAVWVFTDGTSLDKAIDYLQLSIHADSAISPAHYWRWFDWTDNMTRAYNHLLSGMDLATAPEEFSLDLFISHDPGTGKAGTQHLLSTKMGQPSVKKINISVNKVWEGAPNNTIPRSISVQLLANNRVIKTAELTDDNWSYTFENLPEKEGDNFINYSVKEVKVEGYTTTITGDATNGFTITNTYNKYPTVRFIKVGENGQPLAGARFELYVKGNNTVIEAWNTGSNVITVNVNDEIKLRPNVTYVVKEVTVPQGYEKIKDFEFVIGEDGFVKSIVNVDGTGAVNVTWENDTQDSLITITNEKEKKEIQISKIDLGGTEISDAVIQILQENKVVDAWTSNGQVHSVKLAPGEYVFHEVTAPAKYVAVTNITFTVNENGSVTVTNADGNTVATDGNKLTVTDQYKMYSLSLKKVDDDNNVLSGVKFTLTSQDGKTTKTVTTGTDGVANFEDLVLDIYTLKETSGKAGYIVPDSLKGGVQILLSVEGVQVLNTVSGGNVSENELRAVNNTFELIATNKRQEATSVVLQAEKTLTGRDLADGEFSFTLKGEGQNQTKTNNANGTVTFDEITYTQAGTYTYEVRETAGNLGGVTYDTSVYTVVVTVVDNGQGQLVATKVITLNGRETEAIKFANEYNTENTRIVLDATKKLTGRDLADGEFSFTLTGEGQNQTKTNNANGTVTFDEITYTQAGKYTYEVKETQGNLGGVTYDTSVYRVVVTVVDNGQGELVATKVITVNETEVDTIKFANEYNTGNTSIVLEAEKTLTGRDLADGEFSFTLKGEGQNQTKTNVGGTVTFDEITYTQAGTYTYEVRETQGNLGGVTYDASVYTVVVTVTDNGAGELVATKVITLNGNTVDAINFANEYNTDKTSIVLEAEKTLTGRDLADGEFSFTLTGEGQNQTKTNVGGKVTFDAIEYTAAGEYTYTVKETRGNLGGVTYDTSVYTVVVTVVDNGAGELVATKDITLNGNASTVGTIGFRNTYTTGNTGVVLEAEKTLTGRDLADGEFSFTLTGEGQNQTKKNVGGTVTFDVIEYTAAGEYTYTVKEVAGNLGGVTYDASVYTVVVTVVDNGQGELVATKVITLNGDVVDAINFVNEYNTEKTSVVLEAEKTLTGRDLADGEFSFTLTGEGQNQTKTNNANGTVTFDEITYTQAGKYTYEVKETQGNLGGVTYDTSVYTVVVTVVDNGQGELVATKVITLNGNTVDAINFANEYNTDKTSIVLEAEKTLTGRDLADGEFSFTLTGEGQNQTKKNVGGKVTFDAIEYTAAGEYTYTVKEVAGNLGGVTYDKSVYTVVVTVVDNGQGELVATKDITLNGNASTVGTIGFRNTYTTGNTGVVLEAEKTLTGRDLADGEFSFTLIGEGQNQTKTNVGGKVTFDKITYTQAGEYTYEVRETQGTLGGVTYDKSVYTVVVTVTDNGKGELVATKEITLNGDVVDAINFANEYNTEDTRIVLDATKTLAGRDLADGEFSFTLKGEGQNQTKTNVGGTVTFDEITYTQAGTYTYEVRETQGNLGGVTYDASVYTVVVTVTDNGAGELVATKVITLNGNTVDAINFANEYNTDKTSIVLEAEKTLTGRDLADGEFSFTLTGEGQNQTKKNVGGKVTFDAIEYTAAGEYTYTVKEVAGNLGGVTYDKSVYTVVVTVVDNGQGELVATKDITLNGNASTVGTIGFRNTYTTGNTGVVLEAEKTLTGRDLADGEFSFTLTGEGQNQTKKNVGGTVTFDVIEYTAAGEYTYTVKEVAGNLGGVTYDTSVYTVVVTVVDNGAGKLVATKVITLNGDVVDAIKFANEYNTDKTSVVLEAEKTLTGRDLADGEFEFTLSGEGQNQTKKNVGGTVTFDAIEYTAAGEYTYEVKETQGNLGGVTYDTSVYTVVVTVVDNGAGELVATKVITLNGDVVDAIKFANEYNTDKTSVVLEAEKTLTGRDLADGEFEFTLSGEGQNQTKKNVGGTVTFDAIEYTAAGEYTYEVKETQGNLGGVTYDTSVYTVVVTVVDNGAGELVATKVITLNGDVVDAIKFANEYNTDKTSVVLEAEKTLTGRDLADGEFEFTLSGEGQNQTKKNVGGTVTFDVIEYTAAGEYTYEVKETQGNLGGVTYDASVYTVVVTVVDNGAGELVATKVITLNGDVVDAINFANEYTAKETEVVLEATKKLIVSDNSTRALVEGEFKFELVSGTDVIQTVSNNAEGRIVFDAIKFTKAGEYNYIIREVKGTDASIAYDEKEVKVKVTVTDKLDGTFEVEVVYDDAKATPVFTNYELTNIEVTKEWLDDSTQGEFRPAKIEVTLFKQVGTADKVEVTTVELTAADGWKHTFENLPVYESGEKIVYSVEEKAVENYEASYEGTKITNRFTGKAVEISKVAVFGSEELAGATLVLRRINEDGTKPEVDTWISEEGKTHSVVLPQGKYELEETVAPEDYKKLTTTVVFTVKEGIDKKVVITVEDYNALEENVRVENGKITIKNDLNTKEVEFSKVENFGGEEIEGAQIVVTRVDAGKEGVVDEWTSTNESHKLSLVPGNYEFTEKVAPKNYIGLGSEVKVKFTVEEDANGEVVVKVTSTESNIAENVKVTGNKIELKNEVNTTDVLFSKVDAFGGKEIPGATIVVSRINGDGSRTEVQTWTSTDKAHALKLEPGKYEFKETVAPEDYIGLGKDTVIEFEVTENADKTVSVNVLTVNGKVQATGNRIEIVNELNTKEVLFSKVANFGGEELPGATIVLTRVDGGKNEKVDEWTSTNEAHKLSLVPGEYEFKETVAPDGYNGIGAETVVKFRVVENSDGTYTVEVTSVGTNIEENVKVNGNKIELKNSPKPTPPPVTPPDEPTPPPITPPDEPTPPPVTPPDEPEIPDEPTPGGPNEPEIPDEEVPGGDLPFTGGITADVLYGLGALAIMSGIVVGWKKKKN